MSVLSFSLCQTLPRTPCYDKQGRLRNRGPVIGSLSVAPPRPLRHRIAAASAPPTPAPQTSTTPTFKNLEEQWSGYLPNSRGAAVVSLGGRCGGRPKPSNQDSFLTHTVQPLPHTPASIIGVFDGHGRAGHVASTRVKDTMAAVMEQCAQQALAATSKAKPSTSSWDPATLFGATNLRAASALSAGAASLEFTPDAAQSCLGEAFSHAAEAMRVAAADFLQSGSTAVVCMLLHDSVVAAWAGDSRAVMGVADGGRYSAVELTQDHKPNNLGEMARIMAAGGRVARTQNGRDGTPAGPFRVFLPAGLSPGLAVARAFGDLLLSQVGVVPTPDFTVFPLSRTATPTSATKPGHVLIVASDGLWQYIDNQAAVDIAAGAGSPEEAARLLAEAAQQQWELCFQGKHCDDITVAVAFL